MKNFMILLIAMLMSFSTSTFAGTKTEVVKVENSQKFTIPVNVIIKQIITFNDGKSIAVYYKKEGDVCKLYSAVDLNKYKENDLNRIKSTSFEITDHAEGKCIMTKKTADIIKFAKSIVKQLG